MIQIRYINEFPISDMYRAAMATTGKLVSAPPRNLEKFAMRMILAKHSFCNEVRLQIADTECRSDTCSHLVRSTKFLPRHYVQTKRPDITGEDRPKDPTAPRLYLSTWGADALIAMSHQRLCHRSATHTVDWVMGVKYILDNEAWPNEEQQVMSRCIAKAMVPQCVQEYGCCEGVRGCGWWEAHKGSFTDKGILERWYIYLDFMAQI